MAAELPNVHPDVLIIEATYGTHIHEPREERETRFTTLVQDIVSRGGRCLIPVFALGRAQELMLILDEYWSNHPDLHEVPIYYASSLAKRCMTVYQVLIIFHWYNYYLMSFNGLFSRLMWVSRHLKGKPLCILLV